MEEKCTRLFNQLHQSDQREFIARHKIGPAGEEQIDWIALRRISIGCYIFELSIA